MTSAKLRARWTSEHDAEFQARASKRQPGSGKYEGWRQDELVERFGEFEGRADVRGLTLSLLRNVRWSNVDLSYAKLTRSMSNVSLERCLARGIAMLADEISGTLVDSDLREAKIERVHLLAGVTRCSFDGARFQRTTIATTFRATTFVGATFRRAELSRAIFEDCSFTDAVFDQAAVLGCRFVRCTFAGAKFADVMADRNHFDGDAPEPLVREADGALAEHARIRARELRDD